MDETLSAFDPSRPTSGHAPHAKDAPPASPNVEHEWSAAAGILFPVLLPVGSVGRGVDEIEGAVAVAGGTHALVDAGPCELVVAYEIDVGPFHVLANGDHVASWGVMRTEVRSAAMANLAAWSAGAPWSEDTSGRRRVISSDTGDGWDASRILLPEVVAELTAQLGPGARVLVGLPARSLLVAGPLYPDDAEFAPLFADFVLEYSGDSDEPIDRRVFEIVDGALVPFTTTGS